MRGGDLRIGEHDVVPLGPADPGQLPQWDGLARRSDGDRAQPPGSRLRGGGAGRSHQVSERGRGMSWAGLTQGEGSRGQPSTLQRSGGPVSIRGSDHRVGPSGEVQCWIEQPILDPSDVQTEIDRAFVGHSGAPDPVRSRTNQQSSLQPTLTEDQLPVGVAARPRREVHQDLIAIGFGGLAECREVEVVEAGRVVVRSQLNPFVPAGHVDAGDASLEPGRLP